MLRFAIFAAVAMAACLAQGPTLKECHPNGDSAVVITNPKVDPYPPRIPGKVRISLDVEIKRPVDKFDVNVTLTKDLNGFPLRIPCLENVGSCMYRDMCSVLSEAFPDGKCPPVVTQCTCPFKANTLLVRELELDLPQLPEEIAAIVDGKYEVFLSLQDSATQAVLSCLNVKLEIRAGLLYLQ